MKTTSYLSQVRGVLDDANFKRLCFQLWEAHLQWLHEIGFARALEQYEQQMVMPEASGHEVVDLLGDFVMTRGYVNAHFGLTSSDVVDNVRLIQTRDLLGRIGDALARLDLHLLTCFHEASFTVGFTHWQPAAPITWSHRVRAWVAPLEILVNRTPRIHAKQFGGPVGDGASIRLILDSIDPKLFRTDVPFGWSDFGLEAPVNFSPIQSSDHMDELAAVSWCCAVAAQLHKIAADLRFLAAMSMVMIKRPSGHAGSSSMPHKTNPYKWEKVCSICRSVSTTHAEMWSVTAHNGLERTLDTSWQLKALLRRCFEGLALALDEMLGVEACINDKRSADALSFLRDKISSDRDLTRRVLAGENRWSAYQQMLQQENQK